MNILPILICFVMIKSNFKISLADKSSLLERTFDALSRGIAFFEKDYEFVNVDAIIGLRIAQGQMFQALKAIKNRQLFDKVYQLLKRAEAAAEKSLIYTRETQKEYMEQIYFLVKRAYIYPESKRNTFPIPTTYFSDGGYNEIGGDVCFQELYDNRKVEEDYQSICNVSEECAQMMTQDRVKEYFLTHQILFFMEAQKLGCTSMIAQFMNNKQLEDFYSQKCGHVLYDISNQWNDILHNQEYYQDLFMEEVAVCGMLGFKNFFRKEWLEMVLRWQSYSGCFFAEESIHTKGTTRQLMKEEKLADGCLAHKTGVGIAFIGLYFKYLVMNENENPIIPE